MAPIRRYLRISKYSVLECRIYLDNPSLAQSWLLNPRYDVLPRIIEGIRPLVLPKLREERERERNKKKGSKKARAKDVIVQDDFEVSMFLTETSTRHSLLTKKKQFREKGPSLMNSNSSKLIGETNEQPVNVDMDDLAPIRLEPDSDEEAGLSLADIPPVETGHQVKRSRDGESPTGSSDSRAPIDINSDIGSPPTKRLRGDFGGGDSGSDEEEGKKKMAMDVSYEGFAIYGRVLCLVVKRKGGNVPSRTSGVGAEGQAKMENWISSTQLPVGLDE